ncbi:hypothetical protein [Mycolicibacterium vinylchloridicum]|uniref:hypothetical protein n=1 Tax=Mycolicibacterium vinylchloridicum TaxID=2736928 RepID=UPI0015CB61ED|nr:hypothetical protein [Mycolicibacterium vinylchloridicum]
MAIPLLLAGCSSRGGDAEPTESHGGESSVTASGPQVQTSQGPAKASGGCTPYPSVNPSLPEAINLTNEWGRKFAEINGQPPPYLDVWEEQWDSKYEALPPNAIKTLTTLICRQAADPQLVSQVRPELVVSPYLEGAAIYTAVMTCKDFWERSEYDDTVCPKPS